MKYLDDNDINIKMEELTLDPLKAFKSSGPPIVYISEDEYGQPYTYHHKYSEFKNNGIGLLFKISLTRVRLEMNEIRPRILVDLRRKFNT